ncbi:MAG TPA: hypothetical protein VGO00_01530 [Kofleriaceae bacterium]|jgi:hypothetical protein|nr:hypothetical protein [Kofleriaceae bacterium]
MGDTEVWWLLIAVLLALVGVGVLFASFSRVTTRLPIAQLLAGGTNPIRPRRFGIDVARRRFVVALGLLAASVTTYGAATATIAIPASDRLSDPFEIPCPTQYELAHPLIYVR